MCGNLLLGRVLLAMPLVLLALMLPLRILGYNPLNAADEDRVIDIFEEAAGFDVVLLAGMGVKQGGEPFSTKKIANKTLITSGYVNSCFSNKSCGVGIGLGKRFAAARIYDSWELERQRDLGESQNKLCGH